MDIVVARSARKQLERMPRAKAEAALAALRRIAADPFAKYNAVRPLTGIKGGYRLRVGNWRVSYRVDRKSRVLDVFEVAPRGGAYR